MFFEIEDFAPDGTTDYTAPIQDATAALTALGGGTLWFKPGKTYPIWGSGAVARPLDFRGLDGVHVMGNGCTIDSGLTNPALYSAPAGLPFIDVNDASNIIIEGLTFVGGNTSLTYTTGEQFLWWGSANSVGTTNLVVRNCIIKNCQAGVGNSLERNAQSKNITVVDCVFDSCYYPIRTYATDNLTAKFRAVACGRDYFPINPCANHDVEIDSTTVQIASSVLIKIYPDSTKSEEWNTISDIRLRYKNNASGQADTVNLDIEQAAVANDGKGHFRDINLHFDIQGSGGTYAGRLFQMGKVKKDGSADTTERGHTCRGLKISGVVSDVDASMTGGVYVGTGPWNSSYWNATGGSPDIIESVEIGPFVMKGTPAGDAINIDGRAQRATGPFVTFRSVNVDGPVTLTNGARVEGRRFTFTPGMTFGGGSTGMTFSTATGSWIIESGIMHVNGLMNFSAKGSSTGIARITGLPFTIKSGSESYVPPQLRCQNVSYTGMMQGYGDVSTTTIRMEDITEAGTAADLDDTNFGNFSQVLFHLSAPLY